jgi:NADPH-dependent 2,4-dienoyl-CoA reductase/sulfur reductase-like enzyme
MGRRVALIDDNPEPGGQIWRHGETQPSEARQWLQRLESSGTVRFFGARVFEAPAQGFLHVESGDDYFDLHYEKLILATGARELFLPFPGWTVPGVFGAGGLDAMARGGLPIAGKRVVVAGSGPLLLAVAAHLVGRGARIVAICEQAAMRKVLSFATGLVAQPGKLLQGIGYAWVGRGAPMHFGSWPVAAHGETALKAVTLRQGRKQWDIACDFLACGFHLVPNVELARLPGCRIDDGYVAVDAMQQTSVKDVYCAGEPCGIGGVEVALLEGKVAGLAATGRFEEARRFAQRRKRMDAFVRALRETYTLNPELRTLAASETIVCRCEDVRYGELSKHQCWRDAKLQTRCGMGPCQGRVCGAAAEFLFGWRAGDVRPPVFPALVSSLAGVEEISGNEREGRCSGTA